MTCEIVRTKLSAFIDSALPENELREINEHLEECGFCSEVYDGLRAADDFYSAAVEKEVPEDYRESLRERMLTMAQNQKN